MRFDPKEHLAAAAAAVLAFRSTHQRTVESSVDGLEGIIFSITEPGPSHDVSQDRAGCRHCEHARGPENYEPTDATRP